MKPRREPMLPPIRAMSWWWWSVPFLTAGVWATLTWFSPNWAWWMWIKHSAWSVALVFLPVYTVIAFTAVRTRRIRRAYRESGRRLCTRCVQPLNGLGEIGLCPECGEPFHIDVDRARWRHAGIDMGERRGE